MSDYLAGKAVRKVTVGNAVERAAALPPQTAREDIFNIVGGRILLVGIIGEVTVEIGAVGNNTKLEVNPDDAARADLCDVLNITGHAVGVLYGITGTAVDNLVSSVTQLALPASLVLKPGVIELNCAGSSVTGAIKWTVIYVPIDDGAYVEAA